MAISETRKNLIKFIYISSLLIVFGLAVASIVRLKNDTGTETHKNLEFLLFSLSLITIFVVTTHMDSLLMQSASKYPSVVKVVKILSLVAFVGLIIGICSYCFQTDNLDKSDSKNTIKSWVIVIGIFGGLAFALYWYMRVNGFGPESKISSSSADKNISDYKTVALQQVSARLRKECKSSGISGDKKTAYGTIISNINNVGTNDDNKNILLQYCSFLYSDKSYKINNAASIYGPFDYTTAATGTGLQAEKVNLRTLCDLVNNDTTAYLMIPANDTPKKSEGDRSKASEIGKLNQVISADNWKTYSNVLAAKLFSSATGKVKDLLVDPIEKLKFTKPFCGDLISFYPVTTSEPVPLVNNSNWGCK